jgi:hypothetical protein
MTIAGTIRCNAIGAAIGLHGVVIAVVIHCSATLLRFCEVV